MAHAEWSVPFLCFKERFVLTSIEVVKWQCALLCQHMCHNCDLHTINYCALIPESLLSSEGRTRWNIQGATESDNDDAHTHQKNIQASNRKIIMNWSNNNWAEHEPNANLQLFVKARFCRNRVAAPNQSHELPKVIVISSRFILISLIIVLGHVFWGATLAPTRLSIYLGAPTPQSTRSHVFETN